MVDNKQNIKPEEVEAAASGTGTLAGTDTGETKETPVDRKAILIARIKEANPDADVTEDNLFEHLHNYANARDEKFGALQKSVDDFTNLIGNDDYASGFIAHLGSGGHPLDYIIDNWDGDVQELLNDPNRKEKFEAARTAKKTAIEKTEKAEADRQEAMFNSLDRLVAKLDPTIELEVLKGTDEAAKKIQLDKLDAIDEKVQKVVSFLYEIANGFTTGNISDDTLDFALKAINFDNAIADKENEINAAEVRGRNAKIEGKMKKIAGETTNDIPPNIGGQTNRVTPKKKNEGNRAYGFV